MFFVDVFFFFFNDTATTEIYTLSLHDALPISRRRQPEPQNLDETLDAQQRHQMRGGTAPPRSEEHTSELQSHLNLVCRLLLEKKKKTHTPARLFYKKKQEHTPA